MVYVFFEVLSPKDPFATPLREETFTSYQVDFFVEASHPAYAKSQFSV